MKELSIVYAVSEFIPLMNRLLKGKNFNRNVSKIYDILIKITQCDSASEIIKSLNSDSQKMMQFQNAVFEMILYTESNFSDANENSSFPGIRGGSSLAMIGIISIALIGCLFFMVYNGDKLSGEGISIISSVAGIFGACLKDAFSAFFNTNNTEKNNQN